MNGCEPTERDQIAAQMPQARGALQALCGTLGCRVSPLRQIDAIQIDSSTFNKARADSYLLVFVIRNSAAVTLATPAMELTLTDSQDQPVLRRVLLRPSAPIADRDFDEQLCSDVTPSRAATPSRGYIAASTSNCAPM